jgi:hypothetical protein
MHHEGLLSAKQTSKACEEAMEAQAHANLLINKELVTY